jgi:hypothetical protein
MWLCPFLLLPFGAVYKNAGSVPWRRRWTKWHWNRFFSEDPGFPLSKLHTCLHHLRHCGCAVTHTAKQFRVPAVLTVARKWYLCCAIGVQTSANCTNGQSIGASPRTSWSSSDVNTSSCLSVRVGDSWHWTRDGDESRRGKTDFEICGFADFKDLVSSALFVWIYEWF